MYCVYFISDMCTVLCLIESSSRICVRYCVYFSLYVGYVITSRHIVMVLWRHHRQLRTARERRRQPTRVSCIGQTQIRENIINIPNSLVHPTLYYHVYDLLSWLLEFWGNSGPDFQQRKKPGIIWLLYMHASLASWVISQS